MFLVVVLTIGMAGIVFSVFLLFRNHWVYNKRTELLRKDLRKYVQLPSYDAMMWRFWVWDIEKFIKP